MTIPALPYCGAPPLPGELVGRFNLDPVLIVSLILLTCGHLRFCSDAPAERGRALAGWAIAAAAFLSPLCALSVSLFAARVGQHMILVLIAAPLIAAALPSGWRAPLWPAVISFFLFLWFWHMPVPYDATFHSTVIYWSMHVTLFGSAIWLWRALLAHEPGTTMHVLAAGTVSSIQMGLLGAVLTLSDRPMFRWHYFTTQAWGLSPLADQQLGGALMWVPGCLLFLFVALRSCAMLWRTLEPTHAA